MVRYCLLALRRLRHGHLHGGEHILDEDAISRGGIVDEDVGHRAHELAVLNDGGAAQECGQ